MGVKNLWNVLAPASRAVRLESMQGKVLAIDASIWLYQFLKAMRNQKSGDALEGCHLLGFFRRICKLLFWGIKPIFVFDGPAPTLKQKTLAERRRFKEGKVVDVAQTARKLLTTRLQIASLDNRQNPSPLTIPSQSKKHNDPFQLPSVGDWSSVVQQRAAKGRSSRQAEDIRMPMLPCELLEQGKPPNPEPVRTRDSHSDIYSIAMPSSEMEYDVDEREFHTQLAMLQTLESSKDSSNAHQINQDAKYAAQVFKSLDVEAQHDLIARLKDRSRAPSLHRVAKMIKSSRNAMDFSKAQIKNLMTRNFLTRHLHQATGFAGASDNKGASVRRIAGDRRRAYVLVKNEDGVGYRFDTCGQVSDILDANEIDPSSLTVVAKDRASFPLVGVDKVFDYVPENHSSSTNYQSDDDDHLFVPVSTTAQFPPEVQPMLDILPALFSHTFALGQEMLHSAVGWSMAELQAAVLSCNRRLVDTRDAMRHDPRENAIHLENLIFWNDFLDLLIARLEKSRAIDRLPVADDFDLFKTPVTDAQSASSFKRLRGAMFLTDSDTDTESHAKRHKPGLLDLPPSGGLPVLHPVDGDMPLAYTPYIRSSQSSSAPRKSGKSTPVTPVEDLKSTFLDVLQAPDINVSGMNVLRPSSSPLLPELESTSSVSDLDKRFNNAEFDADRIGKCDTRSDVSSISEPRDNFLNHSPLIACPSATDDNEYSPTPVPDEVISSDDFDDDVTFESVSISSPTNEDHFSNTQVTLPNRRIVLLQSDSHAIGADDFSQTRGDRDLSDMSPTVVNGEVLSKDEFDEKLSFESVSIVSQTVNKNHHVSAIQEFNERTVQSQSDSQVTKMDDFMQVLAGPDVKVISPTVVPSEELSKDEFDEDLTFESVSIFPQTDTASPVVIESDIPDQEEELRELAVAQRTEEESFGEFLSTVQNRDQGTIRADLELQRISLESKVRNQKRDADEVTPEMVAETQHLLRMFGIPYITAPAEAEAQCAWLAKERLVDGVVSDDSDCFLFGAPLVYKNMFANAKFVECYTADGIAHHLQLDVGSLIQLAHLMGSDYCTGILGIGAILAMETLVAFPDLRAFGAWARDPNAAMHVPDDPQASATRKKLARVAPNVPVDFPDPQVDRAYMNPVVDQSREPYSWGIPDIESIKRLLWERLEWNPSNTEATLLPVVTAFNRARDGQIRQSNLYSFGFTGFIPNTDPSDRTRRIESNRMKRAIEAKRGRSSAGVPLATADTTHTGRKKTRGAKAPIQPRSPSPSSSSDSMSET